MIEQTVTNNTLNMENDQPLLTANNYAAIYARKSIKTENHSIESQISIAKRKINENGLILYNTYYDEESASRFSYNKRKGYCAMIEAMENNKFKTLVVLKRDRLSRKFDELLDIKRLLKKKKINIIYSGDGEYQPKPDDAYSDFVENIIMGLSQLEPSTIGGRSGFGIKLKHERGEYSPARYLPYGFIRNDKKLTNNAGNLYDLIPHPYRADIVKKIFNEYLFSNEVYSLAKLVKFALTLDDNITESNIKTMISNPIYASIKKPKDDESLFIWDAVQDVYVKNSEKVKGWSNISNNLKLK